ncbi:Uncharacterised protein [Mycobacteroides abscessus subsp. abscessus]|nr:Uncharacterised protein [Mycobacteroides abscessus subsp. abscessus]
MAGNPPTDTLAPASAVLGVASLPTRSISRLSCIASGP